MKLTHLSIAVATTIFMIHPALAGGLERSQQSVNTLFQDGNYAEVTMAHVAPNIKAKDMNGDDASGMIESYNDMEAAVKVAPTKDTAFALFINKPWAVETTYPKGNMFANELGATSANVSTQSINFMAGQKLDKNFMIYGGVDVQTGSGTVQAATPIGAAAAGEGAMKQFPGIVTQAKVDTAFAKAQKGEKLDLIESQIVAAANSPTLYNVKFNKDRTFVPALGFAYEKPDIALRTAVTYRFPAKYKFDTVESLTVKEYPEENVASQKSVTEVTFPQSVTVNFQTGVNEKHQILAKANARWVEWSKFKVAPKLGSDLNDGEPLASYETDSLDMSLGLGKQITPKLAGEASVSFGIGGDKEDPLTLLGPYGAVKGYSVGAQYKVNEALSVSGGAQYMTIEGGKVPSEDPNNPLITVEDSDGFAAGVNIGYKF